MTDADREWLEWQIETAPSMWVPHLEAIRDELDRRVGVMERVRELCQHDVGKIEATDLARMVLLALGRGTKS